MFALAPKLQSTTRCFTSPSGFITCSSPPLTVRTASAMRKLFSSSKSASVGGLEESFAFMTPASRTTRVSARVSTPYRAGDPPGF